MDRRLTREQIKKLCAEFGLSDALVMTVITKESTRAGFDGDDRPTILFERHIFFRQLTARNLIKLRDQVVAERPDLCSSTPGGYGKYSQQHSRLDSATKYHRECALLSCSWGMMQVMGFNYKAAGFDSVQKFINAMYESEYQQVRAGLNFMKSANCLDDLKACKWASFAKKYNGPNYAINHYDTDLAKLYAGIIKNGFKLASES